MASLAHPQNNEVPKSGNKKLESSDENDKEFEVQFIFENKDSNKNSEITATTNDALTNEEEEYIIKNRKLPESVVQKLKELNISPITFLEEIKDAFEMISLGNTKQLPKNIPLKEGDIFVLQNNLKDGITTCNIPLCEDKIKVENPDDIMSYICYEHMKMIKEFMEE